MRKYLTAVIQARRALYLRPHLSPLSIKLDISEEDNVAKKCLVKVGETYGKLTITKIESLLVGNEPTKRRFCTTKCECGNTKINVRPSDLSSGRTTSCGCVLNRRQGRSLTNEYSLWERARKRAKQKSLPFNLEMEDIFIPKLCPLLEIPLFRAKGKASGPCANSPSLDRIIPDLGYIQGNIWVISALANRIKSNATPDQISKLATNLLCLQNFSVEQ